jgi:hypothetical protein
MDGYDYSLLGIRTSVGEVLPVLLGCPTKILFCHDQKLLKRTLDK